MVVLTDAVLVEHWPGLVKSDRYGPPSEQCGTPVPTASGIVSSEAAAGKQTGSTLCKYVLVYDCLKSDMIRFTELICSRILKSFCWFFCTIYTNIHFILLIRNVLSFLKLYTDVQFYTVSVVQRYSYTHLNPRELCVIRLASFHIKHNKLYHINIYQYNHSLHTSVYAEPKNLVRYFFCPIFWPELVCKVRF